MMPHKLDGTTYNTDANSVMHKTNVRPTANQGSLTGDAMLRMSNAMRAKFDEND